MADMKGYFLEDLSVGMSAAYSKTVTESDIAKFAEVSGDNNPLHLDEAFAKTTRFKERIAHGMLSAGFISTILGTKLPGPGSIYLSQSLRFTAPVKIGDTVTARAEITDIRSDKKRVTLATTCVVGETVVIKGEALVMVPSRA